MKLTVKILTLISSFALLFSITGVYADWIYEDDPPLTQEIPSHMAVFEYKPEEVLPDEDEDTEQGTNHLSLLEVIKTDPKLGLNINKKNNLEDALVLKNGFVHCYDNTIHGGNMNNLPDPSRALAYVLECTVENEKIVGNIYLYSFTIISNKPADGTAIVVYRTTFVQQTNGAWQDTTSALGYVLSGDEAVLHGKDAYYILPQYWVAGKPPTTA